MKPKLLLTIAIFLLFSKMSVGAEFVCVAKSREGKSFKGVGGSLQDAENDALNICLQTSLVCRVVKCVQIALQDDTADGDK